MEEFQALIDDSFLLASDVFTIKEEQSFGSDVMKDVTVRINQGTTTTGTQRLGDDFKLILFQDLDHEVYVGSLFHFDNNYWITYNTNVIKNLARSVLVRRCNNVLRWTDPHGNYYESYCSIDYPVKRPTDYVRTIDPVMPGGFINILTQQNENTRKIKPGQRFLFGNTDNWNCFKVYGSGVRNFLNEETENSDSVRIMALVVATDFVNSETDNLALGIADYYDVSYTFAPYPESFEGDIGSSFLLQPNLRKNGVPSDESVAFSTSGSIVSVNPEGMVTLLDYGTTTVNMYVATNTSASASINVEIDPSPALDYEIRISPSNLFIFEKEEETFEVSAYFNGALQDNVFDFSVDTSGSIVPSSSYSFVELEGSRFRVSNDKKFLDYPLIIRAESGSLVREIPIKLRGAW